MRQPINDQNWLDNFGGTQITQQKTSYVDAFVYANNTEKHSVSTLLEVLKH